MSQFFRQAQDPVSCATHAWGAVAAFFGGMVLLLRALWAGANMAALAAAMVFAFSLMAFASDVSLLPLQMYFCSAMSVPPRMWPCRRPTH